MVITSDKCIDHDIPTTGGFIAICLDCGNFSMRSGRHSARKSLEAAIQNLPDGVSAQSIHIFADNEPEISRLQDENKKLNQALEDVKETLEEVTS